MKGIISVIKTSSSMEGDLQVVNSEFMSVKKEDEIVDGDRKFFHWSMEKGFGFVVGRSQMNTNFELRS